jgi:hypothetical protein
MSKQALNRSQEAYDLARKIHDMEEAQWQKATPADFFVKAFGKHDDH